MDLTFLKSNRFWVMIIGSVSAYLFSKGFIGKEEMTLIATISGSFIGIKTIDRFGEKIGKE